MCVCLTYMCAETYTTCKACTERLRLSSMSSCEYSKYNNCEKKTLQPLLAAKIITDSMGTKIARARLNYKHLKLAFDRNGFDGLSLWQIDK